MLDNQPTKTLLIFDPYSINGFLLAQKLHSRGYSVVLYTDRSKHTFESNFTTVGSDTELIICDLSQSCNDNFLVDDFFQQSEYFIVINSLVDIKWLSDSAYNPKNDLHLAQLKKKLILQAEENQVKVVEPKVWHCSPEILDQLITTILDFLQEDSQRRLYFNLLHCDLFLMENDSYLELLEKSISGSLVDNLIAELPHYLISVQDVLRLVFEELGAEIEFCGRAEQERGVIVDYDELVLAQSEFDTSKIRLGNTVVKINESNYSEISSLLNYGIRKEKLLESAFDVLLIAKRLIKNIVGN